MAEHARARWPQLDRVQTRFRANFAYVDAIVAGQTVKLCRLRYLGMPNVWGFAIWSDSRADYEDSWLINDLPSGKAEDAVDTACGRRLGHLRPRP
jgi:hypothetical protein